MGLFEKIKNVLFEEEYIEVEEKPKKPKKDLLKSKDKAKEKEVEKPIAKKVILPEKKEAKVEIEELDDMELLDEDFEIKPKVDEVENDDKKDFKIMEEDDFRVEEEINHRSSEPKIVKVIENEEAEVNREEVRYYQNKKEKQPYGIDESSRVSREYGGRGNYDNIVPSGVYEKKEDRTHFKPSPIISPIYGILDKNYKKEDVVTKKEVRLTSSYARENLSVDDVRKKAYGSLSDDIEKDIIEEPRRVTSFEVEEKKDDESLLVDLSTDNDKPAVKEVTMGDALEYFQDLGLEYNVDYVDASKENIVGRRSRENYDDEVVVDEVKEESKVEKTPEKEDVSIDSDDNLFDLIDSMYKEND